MGRIKDRNRSVAGRVAVASLTMLGAGVIGMVTAPMAFGQIIVIGGGGQSATTTNSGSAGANSGGNTSVGNESTNVATATSSLLGAVTGPLNLGGATNNSTGQSSITTGPATATGNQSGTATSQSNASGNQVTSFPAAQPSQSAGVTNAGGAGANSGGNTSVGNASQNTATITQNASGGLVGLAVNLGSPTNNSTGQSSITTGPATATGNQSSTNVGQGAGHGAGAPCSSTRFSPFGGGQSAGVSNRGAAEANSGDNTSIGNASTNEASTNVTSTDQTAVGGVLGLTLNLAGPVNNSTGASSITTGPATAVGNSSATRIGQGCGEVATLSAAGRPSVVAVPPGRSQQAQVALARTGLDTGDLGMIAGVSLAAGMLLVASQRRRVAARQAMIPMAGFGLGLGADDWDTVATGR